MCSLKAIRNLKTVLNGHGWLVTVTLRNSIGIEVAYSHPELGPPVIGLTFFLFFIYLFIYLSNGLSMIVVTA